MPTPTYDLIASNVLTSNTATITFSSIPATYRDLIVVISGELTATNRNARLNFNNDTASNYSYVYASGNGSTTASAAASAQAYLDFAFVPSDRFVIIINVEDYSATDKHKATITRASNFSGEVAMWAGRWASTSAINEIDFIVQSASSYASGTSFHLYGIVS